MSKQILAAMALAGCGLMRTAYADTAVTENTTVGGRAFIDLTKIGYTGETQLFIKKAYVQARISDAFFVRAGSADLPWIPFAEANYGYRYVELVILDRLKFGTSADWGVHAGGKMADGM